MVADREIELNLKTRVFYHGTDYNRAEQIVAEGFRVPRYEKTDIGNGPASRVLGCGSLGVGLYLTCNWKIALQYGSVLFRVSIARGTRILDASVPPDRKILDRLRREFGHRILDENPRKALPNNKQLLLPELVALARHHFRKDFMSGRRSLRPEKNIDIFRKTGMRPLLQRYQFAGVGNPDDQYGIVIFMSARVVLEELVLEWGGWKNHAADYWEAMTLDQLKQKIAPFGTFRAARLAGQLELRRTGFRGAPAAGVKAAAARPGPRSVASPPADWCLSPDVIARPVLVDYWFEPPGETILDFSNRTKPACFLAVARKRLSSVLAPGDIRLLEQSGGRRCGDDAYEAGRFHLSVNVRFILVESCSSIISAITRTDENDASVARIKNVVGGWLHAGCVLLLELSRVMALDTVMQIPIPLAVTDLKKRGKDDRWEIVDFLGMREIRLSGYPNPVVIAGESERYLELERDLDLRYQQKLTKGR